MSGIRHLLGRTRINAANRRGCSLLVVVVTAIGLSGATYAAESKSYPVRMRPAIWPAANAARTNDVAERWRDETMVLTSSQFIAGRVEDVALLSTLSGSEFPFNDGSPASLSRRPVAPQAAFRPARSKTFEPDGWWAVSATLALGIFFFMRRIAR